MKNRKGMVGLALGIMMILTPGKAFAGEFFSPFTGSDWAGFGLTAIADFAESLIALALPERWRGATWGLYVGIGVADTVCNSYSGGVVFRF